VTIYNHLELRKNLGNRERKEGRKEGRRKKKKPPRDNKKNEKKKLVHL